MTKIALTVNGMRHEVDVDAGVTLLDLLREDLHLTGSKRGCDIGACGACTVIVNGETVLGCMTQAVRCKDKEITTVEGLVQNGELHPLQASAIAHGAVQCGFCTPGWLMSAKALLDRKPDASRDDIKEALSGNFCRCTGYQKIIESIVAVAETNATEAE